MPKPLEERWAMVVRDLRLEATALEETFEQWTIDSDPGIRAVGQMAWGLAATLTGMGKAIREGIGDCKRPEEEG